MSGHIPQMAIGYNPRVAETPWYDLMDQLKLKDDHGEITFVALVTSTLCDQCETHQRRRRSELCCDVSTDYLDTLNIQARFHQGSRH